MILLVGNIFNLVIGHFIARLFAMLAQVPKPLFYPLIFMMAVTETHAFRGNPYDVIIMMSFGLLGYGMIVTAYTCCSPGNCFYSYLDDGGKLTPGVTYHWWGLGSGLVWQ